MTIEDGRTAIKVLDDLASEAFEKGEVMRGSKIADVALLIAQRVAQLRAEAGE